MVQQIRGQIQTEEEVETYSPVPIKRIPDGRTDRDQMED